MSVKVQVINKGNWDLPEYKTDGASGMDLRASIDAPVVIKPLERALIPTGLYLAIPKGYEGQIRARSGLALKNGIALANGVGTIDSDYRGEIKVILVNLSNEDFTISDGDRIAQLILTRYEEIEFEIVEDLDKTDRDTGGFGHTGI